MKTTLALTAFAPDQPARSGLLMEANNVYPKVEGYGSFGGFSGFSDALPAAFKGGGSFIAKDGTSSLLVGTANGLLRYSGGAWVTLLAAMSVSAQWRFAQFGDYVVAVNGVETKVVDLVASTASALTGAPAGTCVAIVGDYVVIGQDSNDLLGITTSAEGSHTDWNVVASTATYQPMLAGGEVMGLASGEFGVILQRGRLVRMSRTGDPVAPFQYDVITENIGCASKGSVQQFGNMVFFLSDSGFKMLVSGQELKAIGSEKVDRTFASAVPRDDWGLIYSAVDPQSKTVIWCVPGVPGKLWIYNWELDRWSTGSLNIEAVMAGFTSSVDLEALAVTYPNLDAMTISLDDPRWSGGNPRLYAVNGGVLGTFFGDTLQATFGYGFVELTPGAVARVRSLRPLIDADEGQTVRVDSYARMTDAVDSSSTAELRPSGIMPVRCSGRYVRPRWTIDAGTAWSFAQGLEVDYEVGGGR